MQEDWEIKPKDYYKILQIDPSAEPEVIEAAYKRLSHKYHPDKNPNPEAQEKMKDINKAYEILKDPKKRKKYDKWYSESYKKGESSKTFLPPKPEVEPNCIYFDNVIPGELRTASFVIKNTGGDYKKIKIFVSNQNSWLKIAHYSSLTTSDELPLQVEIEAKGEQWNTRYSEEIIVQLDNEETQVKVELQTQPVSVKAVVLETKWLIAALLNKIKTTSLLRLPIPIKKRYVFSLIGLGLLIMIGTNLIGSVKTLPSTQELMAIAQTNYKVQKLLSNGAWLWGLDTRDKERVRLGLKLNEDLWDIYINPSAKKVIKIEHFPGFFRTEKEESKKVNKVSRQEDEIKKSLPQKSIKTPPIKTSFIITGTFVDRNGNSVQARYWLIDEKDQKHPDFPFDWSPTALSNGSFKTVAVADGEYRLHIEVSDYFGEPKTLEKKVKVSGSDVNLGNVVLPYSWITGTFVDRNGNSVQARYWLIDEKDQKHPDFPFDWSPTALSNGSFKTVAVADGEYRLHIEAKGYKTLEKKVIVAGKDVSLGQIILTKQE